MSIILDETAKVVSQGITGRQGKFHTPRIKDYGTKVAAGCTPGKGGEEIAGIPVYDSVEEAMERHDINASVIFVPAFAAGDAMLEAIDAELDPIVVITEGIPVHDTMKAVRLARKKGIHLIGPNTPGIISPEKSHVGIMPHHRFKPGNVGIISRSGTLTYEIADGISAINGQSTCLGLGGDPITGLDFIDVLKLFEDDEETKAVVMIGEIGGTAEERAAEYIGEEMIKPVFAYIAGRTAPPGKRMGHAGAIIAGGEGSADEKVEALENAGVKVGRTPAEVVKLVKDVL